MRGDGPDWLDEDEGYTFLILAAHEARKASRKYWAKDGWADRRYPVLPSRGWEPIGAVASTVIEDLNERLRRRRR